MTQSVLEFVEANRQWAAVLAFSLAFVETFAFVSLLVPSTVILAGVGTLVAAGALDFPPIWAGAATGALTGSTISFLLGRRYGPALLTTWPLSRKPGLADRCRAAFARWGTPAVFIAHFVGPLRSVAFILAGGAAMRQVAFQTANVPGALIWAWVIPKSGELGGALVGTIWRSIGGGA